MRQSLWLGSLAALQLVAALGLQMIVLRLVGAGAQSDGFVMAQTVPILIVAVLAGPMQTIWIARLSGIGRDRERWQAAHGIAHGQMACLMAATVLPLGLLASLWQDALFPGLAVADRADALNMTRLLLAASVLNCHALLCTAALRSQHRFLLPEVTAAGTGALALVAVAWVVPQHGVMSAAWVLLARAALGCACLYQASGRPIPNLAACARKAPWQGLAPMLGGASLYKLNPLVDRYWGSLAPMGGLTLLTLAHSGMGALAQVLERALSVPVAPRLAPLAMQGQYVEMWRLLRRSLLRALLISAVIGVGLLLLLPVWEGVAHTLLKLSPDKASQIWWICLFLLGFLYVSAVGGLPVAAFAALGDTRTPVLVSALSFCAGIVLKSAGFLLSGLPGLVIATSTYYLANFTAVTLMLRKRLHDRSI